MQSDDSQKNEGKSSNKPEKAKKAAPPPPKLTAPKKNNTPPGKPIGDFTNISLKKVAPVKEMDVVEREMHTIKKDPEAYKTVINKIKTVNTANIESKVYQESHGNEKTSKIRFNENVEGKIFKQYAKKPDAKLTKAEKKVKMVQHYEGAQLRKPHNDLADSRESGNHNLFKSREAPARLQSTSITPQFEEIAPRLVSILPVKNFPINDKQPKKSAMKTPSLSAKYQAMKQFYKEFVTSEEGKSFIENTEKEIRSNGIVEKIDDAKKTTQKGVLVKGTVVNVNPQQKEDTLKSLNDAQERLKKATGSLITAVNSKHSEERIEQAAAKVKDAFKELKNATSKVQVKAAPIKHTLRGKENRVMLFEAVKDLKNSITDLSKTMQENGQTDPLKSINNRNAGKNPGHSR